MGDGFAVLVHQINRVHQFAIDIQLDLIERLIAHPHRLGAAVAAQVVEGGFRQFLATVDAVQDVDLGRLAAAVADPAPEPAHIGVGFLDETQAHERIDGERGIADPGIAVVPVAFAAGRFRQPERGRGDDGAVFARGQEFQRQGRAVDHLAPAPAIVGLADPTAPELQGALQVEVGTVVGDARILLATEDKFGAFILGEGKGGDGGVALEGQRLTANQAQAGLAAGGEHHAGSLGLRLGGGPGIVVAHGAAQVDSRLATDHPYPPDQQGQFIDVFADGQQVGDLHHRFIAQPASLQHVGVGQVDLLAAGVGQVRGKLERAGLGRVEQCAKHRRAVEFRPAEEVDAAAVVHQCRAAHVADDPVGIDGALRFVLEINHCHGTPGRGSYRHR